MGTTAKKTNNKTFTTAMLFVALDIGTKMELIWALTFHPSPRLRSIAVSYINSQEHGFELMARSAARISAPRKFNPFKKIYRDVEIDAQIMLSYLNYKELERLYQNTREISANISLSLLPILRDQFEPTKKQFAKMELN